MNGFKYTLYGDGIHDDHPAIQERIDSGACELVLPPPAHCYLISRTLVLPSGFRLVLPRFARIKLANGANCPMLSNRLTRDFADRLPADASALCRHLWYFVNEYSPEVSCENIEVRGGIWDFNNQNQLPNPEQSKNFEPYGYTGDGMLFYGVRGLILADMTLKDPVHYGVTFDRVSYFTVENIMFDYNYGNPRPLNMDGIHLNGNCHFGAIRNLKGACYDDLVALNAHEGSRGPITNIEIDGIFAEDCHSAVRLLTVHNEVKNIAISHVYGTYYQYCIGISKFYSGVTDGRFDAITLSGIYASKAARLPVYKMERTYVYPLIWVQEDTVIDHLTVTELYREEHNVSVPTVYVGKNARVGSLIIDRASSENHIQAPMPMLVNCGTVKRLSMTNISAGEDEVLVNEGEILNLQGV